MCRLVAHTILQLNRDSNKTLGSCSLALLLSCTINAFPLSFDTPTIDVPTHSQGPVIGYGDSCCNASLPEGGPHCNQACDYVALVEKQAAALKAVAGNQTKIFIYTNAFCASNSFGYVGTTIEAAGNALPLVDPRTHTSI